MKRTYRIMKGVIGVSIIATLILSTPILNEVAFAQGVTYNPDGSTTTTFRDDRYGKGTREETRDIKGRVTRRVWKDRQGRTLETEDTTYGLGVDTGYTGGYPIGNEKKVKTTVYNPIPGGGTTIGRVTTTDTDGLGNETSTETQIFDAEGNQTGGTKTETDPNGRRKTYRWDPEKGTLVEFVAAGSSGQSAPSAARGFGVANELAGGLNTTIFSTPRGKIRVNLPDDMAAGDTLSGTVIAEPEGKNQNEQAKNEGELNGYVVELEKQKMSATRRIFKLAIPAAISTATYLVLRDKKGKEVARGEVPLARTPLPVEEFDLPTIAQQGRSVEIRGPFDGDFGTTNVKVRGEDLEMLAESPRKIIARNTSGQVGPSELEVKEKNQTARGEFRTLGIKLSAPKLSLLKGEQTTLTLVVRGLEGIKEEVPLEIENKSSGVLQMGGGEMQRITIGPTQVRGGTYTTERPLTGIRRGAFTIIGTIIGRSQGPQGPKTAAGLPPEFTQCDCDCPGYVFKGGQTGTIICPNDSTCSQLGCKCLMFRRAKGSTDLVPEPDGGFKGDGVTPNLLLYQYLCYCVK